MNRTGRQADERGAEELLVGPRYLCSGGEISTSGLPHGMPRTLRSTCQIKSTMVPPGFVYSEAEWMASVGHHPLRDRPAEDLALLHRHWMWANQQREVFDSDLLKAPDDHSAGLAMLATRGFGFLFTWYALLWVVIEACIDPKEGRNVEIRGEFRRDIDEMSDVLRRFRNAILHVPRAGGYIDQRLVALVSQPDSAATLRRIHAGFALMFLEEYARRQESAPAAPPSDFA